MPPLVPPPPNAAQLLQIALDSLNFCTEHGVIVDQQIVSDITSAVEAQLPGGQGASVLKPSLYGSISTLEELRERVETSVLASEGWQLKRKLSRAEVLLSRLFQSYAAMAQATFLCIALGVAFVLYQAQERLYLGFSLYNEALQIRTANANLEAHNSSANPAHSSSSAIVNADAGPPLPGDPAIVAQNNDDFDAEEGLLQKWLKGCQIFPLKWFIPTFLIDDGTSKLDTPSVTKARPPDTTSAPKFRLQPESTAISATDGFSFDPSQFSAPAADESLNLQVSGSKSNFVIYKFLIDLLTSYICPCLGGVLGSSVYVLRMINLRTIRHDLSDRCISTYFVRLFLGGIFGTVISWFTGAGGTPEAWKSLPPLALSFIAGYNIEIVFTALDKLIAAFSPASPLSLQQNKPRG